MRTRARWVTVAVVCGFVSWVAWHATRSSHPVRLSDRQAFLLVEQYYTQRGVAIRRPAGVLVGCPTRTALLWYDCEFDDPSADAAMRITCVHVWVGYDDMWEDSRYVITTVARARSRARKLERIAGSPCSNAYGAPGFVPGENL
jgi:hypothetical protein